MEENNNNTTNKVNNEVWQVSEIYKGVRKKNHERVLNVNYTKPTDGKAEDTNAPAQKPKVQAIYGGNAGVLVKGVPYASDTSPCVRKMMLRDSKIETPIDFRACVTFAVGYAVEAELCDKYAHEGRKVVRGDRVHTELLTGLAETDDGRPFAMFDEADILVDGIPYEVKSVASVSVWEKVFIGGEPKFDNVIQAAHHMLARKIPEGRLVYVATLYHSKDKTVNKVKTKHRVRAGDTKEFRLVFKKDGLLYVDGQAFHGVSLKGLKAWREWASLAVYNKDWSASTPKYWRVLTEEGDTSFKMKAQDGEEINPVCSFCDYRTPCKESTNYNQFMYAVLRDIQLYSEENKDNEEDE